MQGLDTSREFYKQYGKPMLEEQFSDVIDRIAVGLAGEGSECFGYDDKISQDHDFDAGFCLWITAEDEEKFGFRLERAYSKLPKEFMGLRRSLMSPVGGNRHGVITVESFYTRFLGTPNAPNTVEQWLYIPSCSLANATNGEVFADNLGVFSEIRNELKKGYPEDVRRKKLASHIIFMAQSGQYNYSRCVSRGELGSAQLAIFEFVRNAISAIYLLNNAYEPFYKWAYRGLENLEILGSISDALQGLTELDNSPQNVKTKQEVIEDIAILMIKEFKNQDITKAQGNDLEKHAYSILDSIKDNTLRNMHIMDGI